LDEVDVGEIETRLTSAAAGREDGGCHCQTDTEPCATKKKLSSGERGHALHDTEL
jgi:hypothetical protein